MTKVHREKVVSASISAVLLLALSSCGKSEPEIDSKYSATSGDAVTGKNSLSSIQLPSPAPIYSRTHKDPLAVMNAYVKQSNAWLNAGAMRPVVETKEFQESGDIEEFAAKLAAKTDNAYVSALFAPNWRSDNSLVAAIDRQERAHASTIAVFIATVIGDKSLNKEPYVRRQTVRSAKLVSQSMNRLTIDAIIKDGSNSAKNDAVAITNVDHNLTPPSSKRVTFQKMNGTWKVAHIGNN